LKEYEGDCFLSVEEVLKRIEEFCYDDNTNNKYSHDSFQSNLSNSLQRFGCHVIEEYEVIFDCVKENGEIVERRGLIDFFVIFKQKKIAIEFDNGNRLKLKSISKLLQSKADVRIGIVRGNKRYNVWWSNKRRIAQVMRRLQIINKPILLIIIFQKSSSWIYPYP